MAAPGGGYCSNQRCRRFFQEEAEFEAHLVERTRRPGNAPAERLLSCLVSECVFVPAQPVPPEREQSPVQGHGLTGDYYDGPLIEDDYFPDQFEEEEEEDDIQVLFTYKSI